jgi:hypothetical protein
VIFFWSMHTLSSQNSGTRPWRLRLNSSMVCSAESQPAR